MTGKLNESSVEIKGKKKTSALHEAVSSRSHYLNSSSSRWCN